MEPNLSPTQQAPHIIDDTRSGSRRRDKAPVRRPRTRRRVRPIVIGVCLLMALVSATILVADYLIPQGITAYVTAAMTHTEATYAVSAGSYDTLDQARAASEVARSMGGAGFVLFDGRYHVLLNAYPARQDAQAVVDKGGYTLYPLVTEGPRTSDFPLRLRGKVRGLLDCHLTLFDDLYDWSVQLAEGGTTVAYTQQRIAAMAQALQSNADDFLTASAQDGDATVLNYRCALQGMLGALQTLTEVQCDDIRFLAELRWSAILILRLGCLL